MSAMLLLACGGCERSAVSQVDEQRNPFFVAGKERIAARDYKGAIAAFEKALEGNPRFVLAHFELGVLYEQYSDQKETDYISAMYHYQQVIRLRPNEYPADNARQRLAGCKQELVKGEALAPVAHNIVRENDRLKEENRSLQQQLQALRLEAGRGALPDRAGVPVTAAQNALSADSTADAATRLRSEAPPAAVRVAPQPRPSGGIGSRSHTVQQGETAYSIARRYGVSVQSLLTANPRVNPKRMQVGQVLAVPSS